MNDKRDRTSDLDKLADSVIGNLEDGGESYWGLDGKRPFGYSGWSGIGSSVLDIIDATPDGSDDGPDTYSEDQLEYGYDLFRDVLSHIKDRWRGFRGGHQS